MSEFASGQIAESVLSHHPTEAEAVTDVQRPDRITFGTSEDRSAPPYILAVRPAPLAQMPRRPCSGSDPLMPLQHITLSTKDGTCPAALASPALPRPSHPGVILYMDAFGPRPALYDMAERLAENGYFTLVPDLYYRIGPYEAFDAKTTFANPDLGPKLRAIMAGTTQALTERDGEGFIAALTEAGVSGRIGTVGYCMGGARALIAAAAYPKRIAAAASFHGGNLASDAPDSPHLRAPEMKARVYAGSAGVDGSFPPEQSARFAKALREAEVDHMLENYVGMSHGWAVSDHNAYHPAGAERHWTRLLTFFEETL